MGLYLRRSNRVPENGIGFNTDETAVLSASGLWRRSGQDSFWAVRVVQLVPVRSVCPARPAPAELLRSGPGRSGAFVPSPQVLLQPLPCDTASRTFLEIFSCTLFFTGSTVFRRLIHGGAVSAAHPGRQGDELTLQPDALSPPVPGSASASSHPIRRYPSAPARNPVRVRPPFPKGTRTCIPSFKMPCSSSGTRYWKVRSSFSREISTMILANFTSYLTPPEPPRSAPAHPWDA